MRTPSQPLLKSEFIQNDVQLSRSEKRTAGLCKAALERKASVDLRIRQAMREIDAEGDRVDFVSVSRRAGVSRQSIYVRKDVAQEIVLLRNAHNLAPGTKLPISQRATEESAKARLYLLFDENKKLKSEIAELRKRLAEMLGEQRRSALVSKIV